MPQINWRYLLIRRETTNMMQINPLRRALPHTGHRYKKFIILLLLIATSSNLTYLCTLNRWFRIWGQKFEKFKIQNGEAICVRRLKKGIVGKKWLGMFYLQTKIVLLQILFSQLSKLQPSDSKRRTYPFSKIGTYKNGTIIGRTNFTFSAIFNFSV